MNERVRPFDRHGREMRAGDLMGHPQYRLFRLVSEFSSYKRGVAGEVVVQCSDGSARYWADCEDGRWGNYEVIARGSPSDPVPERFEPERDAEGRPVLYVHVIYLHMDGSVTRERIREHDAEISAPTPPRDTMVDELRPPVNGAPIDFSRVGSVKDVKDYVCAGCESELPLGWHDRYCVACLSPTSSFNGIKFPPPNPGHTVKIDGPQPDVHASYVGFDARVREIVAEEAPRATLVTEPFGGETPGCRAWLSFGCHEVVAALVYADGTDCYDACAHRLVFELALAVGQGAMGKVGAKERGR